MKSVVVKWSVKIRNYLAKKSSSLVPFFGSNITKDFGDNVRSRLARLDAGHFAHSLKKQDTRYCRKTGSNQVMINGHKKCLNVANPYFFGTLFEEIPRFSTSNSPSEDSYSKILGRVAEKSVFVEDLQHLSWPMIVKYNAL